MFSRHLFSGTPPKVTDWRYVLLRKICEHNQACMKCVSYFLYGDIFIGFFPFLRCMWGEAAFIAGIQMPSLSRAAVPSFRVCIEISIYMLSRISLPMLLPVYVLPRARGRDLLYTLVETLLGTYASPLYARNRVKRWKYCVLTVPHLAYARKNW